MQCLITDVNTNGLNLLVLGYFDGTIDEYHIGEESSSFEMGLTLKARVLYDSSSSPPRFALSLTTHIVGLTPRLIQDGDSEKSILEVYPIGTVLKVKVIRVEPERGLTAQVSDNVKGFVHVSVPRPCVEAS